MSLPAEIRGQVAEWAWGPARTLVRKAIAARTCRYSKTPGPSGERMVEVEGEVVGQASSLLVDLNHAEELEVEARSVDGEVARVLAAEVGMTVDEIAMLLGGPRFFMLDTKVLGARYCSQVRTFAAAQKARDRG